MNSYDVICRTMGSGMAKKLWAVDAPTAMDAIHAIPFSERVGWIVEAHPKGQWRRKERDWRIRRHSQAAEYHYAKARELQRRA
jgi:hypothetical protein